MPPMYADVLKLLADQRRVLVSDLITYHWGEDSSNAESAELFYQWYQNGYICFPE